MPGRVLSPKLFAINIDDLSQDLVMCKSGCYISEQCMNHVMYAICLLAPSAIDQCLGHNSVFTPYKTHQFINLNVGILLTTVCKFVTHLKYVKYNITNST